MMHVLIISPLFDIPTFHSNHVAFQVQDFLKTNYPSHHVRYIQHIWANPFMVIQTLNIHKWDLVMYYGHGDLQGWKSWGRHILNLRDVEGIDFHGAIIWAFACETLPDFGTACINANARAYIGNTHPIWAALPNKERNYASDFMKIWFQEIVGLFEGFTVDQCVKNTRASWAQIAEEYKGMNTHWSLQHQTRALENGNFHGYVGDGNARLRPQ